MRDWDSTFGVSRRSQLDWYSARAMMTVVSVPHTSRDLDGMSVRSVHDHWRARWVFSNHRRAPMSMAAMMSAPSRRMISMLRPTEERSRAHPDCKPLLL